MTDSYKEQAKIILEKQLKENESKYKKLKRKRKIVRVVFGTMIVFSITSSTITGAIASLTVPPLATIILSITTIACTSLSVKFNLEGRKKELNQAIEDLDKIKKKLDYLVTCADEAELVQVVSSL
jgi:Flp pilus assembly protein TadB